MKNLQPGPNSKLSLTVMTETDNNVFCKQQCVYTRMVTNIIKLDQTQRTQELYKYSRCV